jgi:hypothetical protein
MRRGRWWANFERVQGRGFGVPGNAARIFLAAFILD